MTIYRLYAHNGNRAGFWVQHRSWANACAQVQSIAGQSKGRLPGASPLHDNAEVLVRAFDVRSGRPVTLGPRLEEPQDQKFSLIAKPWWFHGDDNPAMHSPETPDAGRDLSRRVLSSGSESAG